MRLKTFLICTFLILNITLFGQSVKQKFATALAKSDTEMQLELANALAGQYTIFTYKYYGLVLNNLPINSVLITNSKDDTFPLTILQLTSKLRPDVKIISLGMLKDSTYRNFVNTTYALKLTEDSPDRHILSITKSLSNVHISTTVKSSIWFKPSYYLEGLTVLPDSKNQIKKLTAFYHSYQKSKVKSSAINGSDRDLLKNTLPPLITLYKSGEKSVSLKRDILQLAKIVGESERVNKIIAAE